MIKADIVQRVSDAAELSHSSANEAVGQVFAALKHALGEGRRIELRGFGVFEVRRRKRGVGRNPRTGVEVEIAPGRSVRFKPGKFLREV